MKILFAAPDRDLLECYKQLFEADLGQTAAAFDGTRRCSRPRTLISLYLTETYRAWITGR